MLRERNQNLFRRDTARILTYKRASLAMVFLAPSLLKVRSEQREPKAEGYR
jgi:hypothetical protein